MGTLRYHPAIAPTPDLPSFELIRALCQWDAGWYGSIARDGYWYHPGQQSPVAFFPGYPLLIHAATVLGMNRWLAGIALTLTCGLLGIVLFERWARTLVPSEVARLSTLLLITYPFAFYLYGVVYSDALYLLLGVGAFLALESDRPVLAGLLGAIATAARPIAPALVLGLLVRSIERRRQVGLPVRWVDFAPAVSVAGLLAYMAYLGVAFGDPLAFAHVQSAPGWDQGAGWHTWLKVSWFRVLFPHSAPLVAVRLVGHALVTVIMLALVIPMRKRLGWGYALYVAAAVGMPAISTKDFQGLGRYGIAAFPCYVTLALLLNERPRWMQRAYLVASGCVLCALAFSFGGGGYVS